MNGSGVRAEVIGDCTLYLGDCREMLPNLPRADAVVTDPPYGVGENARKVASRGTSSARVRRHNVTDYGEFEWDAKPLDAETFAMVRAAGKWAIIFGGNYYTCPPSSCWLVWDKLNTGDFADCELAWTNLAKAVRRFRYLWNGCMRANKETRGDHPTQKPVGVMLWALQQLPADCRSVIDPLMGSGTTGVACVRRGLFFTGIEREPRYFEAACRRIEEAYRQPRLFAEAPPKPVQSGLFPSETT